MGASGAFVVVSLAVLAILAALVFVAGRRRGRARLTRVAGLAWAFTLAGLVFGEDRLIGYGLLGIGVVLALFDIYSWYRSR